MRILYIHGFGAEAGGSLEQALGPECASRGVELEVIRWPSGDLRTLVHRRLAASFVRYVLQGDPRSTLLRAVHEIHQDARQSWKAAKRALDIGVSALHERLRFLEHSGDEFAVLGFSLGCQVLERALRSFTPPPNLRCVAFVGGAISSANLPRFPRSAGTAPELLNVYSRSDAVIRWLYPFFDGVVCPAGNSAIDRVDVLSIELECGHSGYCERVETLVDLVSCGFRRIQEEIRVLIAEAGRECSAEGHWRTLFDPVPEMVPHVERDAFPQFQHTGAS